MQPAQYRMCTGCVRDALHSLRYTAGMKAYLLVFLGAGLGGALRHGVNLSCARYCGPAFPWGTLVVNVLGSLLMGVAVGYFTFRAGPAWTGDARIFATTGVLGGFTTFSAFSLDAIALWERGATGAATVYVLGSVICSLVALIAGLAVARGLT